jgi:hypothetical protein
MSHDKDERRFWFRGSTMAVGGQITSPIRESIEPQGACVLSPGGGYASAAVENFNFRNIVRFERVTSILSGQKVRHDGGLAGETLVTTAIEGLNILDVITADRVVARITSQHKENERESEILPFGSQFENLRIGGIPIELESYPELLGGGRYKEITHSSRSGSFPFIDANGNPIKTEEPQEQKESRFPSDRTLLAPLFRLDKKKGVVPVGCRTKGQHGILVPGFGIVYLGEYLITRDSRQLTMLRIELGCPISGSIVCANAIGNGHWDP